MCSDIADVALMVCAGPHSVAGACTADRFDGSSAAGGRRRQQAAHHKRLRSLPRGMPELGSAPVRRPRTRTGAVDMRAEVVHTGVRDRRGQRHVHGHVVICACGACVRAFASAGVPSRRCACA